MTKRAISKNNRISHIPIRIVISSKTTNSSNNNNSRVMEIRNSNSSSLVTIRLTTQTMNKTTNTHKTQTTKSTGKSDW